MSRAISQSNSRNSRNSPSMNRNSSSRNISDRDINRNLSQSLSHGGSSLRLTGSPLSYLSSVPTNLNFYPLQNSFKDLFVLIYNAIRNEFIDLALLQAHCNHLGMETALKRPELYGCLEWILVMLDFIGYSMNIEAQLLVDWAEHYLVKSDKTKATLDILSKGNAKIKSSVTNITENLNNSKGTDLDTTLLDVFQSLKDLSHITLFHSNYVIKFLTSQTDTDCTEKEYRKGIRKLFKLNIQQDELFLGRVVGLIRWMTGSKQKEFLETHLAEDQMLWDRYWRFRSHVYRPLSHHGFIQSVLRISKYDPNDDIYADDFQHTSHLEKNTTKSLAEYVDTMLFIQDGKSTLLKEVLISTHFESRYNESESKQDSWDITKAVDPDYRCLIRARQLDKSVGATQDIDEIPSSPLLSTRNDSYNSSPGARQLSRKTTSTSASKLPPLNFNQRGKSQGWTLSNSSSTMFTSKRDKSKGALPPSPRPNPQKSKSNAALPLSPRPMTGPKSPREYTRGASIEGTIDNDDIEEGKMRTNRSYNPIKLLITPKK